MEEEIEMPVRLKRRVVLLVAQCNGGGPRC